MISSTQLGASYIEFRMTDERDKKSPHIPAVLEGNSMMRVWVLGGKKTFDPIATDVKELTITPIYHYQQAVEELNSMSMEEEIEIKF